MIIVMIIDSSRKEKKLDIDSNANIHEKLNQFEKYFQGKSSLQIIDTETIVFENKNNQYDVLNQLKSELLKYFCDKVNYGLFDILDELIKDSRSNNIDCEILQFIHNTQQDIKMGDYDIS